MATSKRPGARTTRSDIERGQVGGRNIVVADTRSYDHLMAQEKLRQEQELGPQRLDETQPGGFFLHPDKKTAHDAFGRPLDPETGELLKSDNVEFHPVTGDPMPKGQPLVGPGVSLIGTPTQIDARRESWLREQEKLDEADRDYELARSGTLAARAGDASTPHGSAFPGTATEAADEPSEEGTPTANQPGDPPGPPLMHEATGGRKKRGRR